MSERAHPDDPGFRRLPLLRWRRGFIPWFSFRRNPFRDAFFWRYRWVKRACRSKAVLDIPCGMGWGTAQISGCRLLVGADISLSAAAEARSRYGKQANFLVSDMGRLPFSDGSFDVVSCLEGIEHVECAVARDFVREAYRTLKPNGSCYLSSPHSPRGKPSGNVYHKHEYRPEEMEGLLAPFFVIEREIVRRVSDLTVSYYCLRKRPSAVIG